MGSTITCRRRAAAVPSSNGPVYFLFEETYESNVLPHRPHWGCAHIGDAASSLKRIFAYGSSCEGGMLRTRSGTITPEGYIQSWLKELAEPFLMAGSTSLRRSTGEYDWRGIDPQKLAGLRPLLSAEEAAAFEAGEYVRMDCVADAERLAAIVASGVTAWRLIDGGSVPGDWAMRHPELGHAPAPSKACPLDQPQAYRLPDGDNVLLRDEKGIWRCAGWDYSVVGGFIERAWETELAMPGTYRKRIKAYREAITAALPLPAGTIAKDLVAAAEIVVTEETSRSLGWRKRDEIEYLLPEPPKGGQLPLFAA
ncbi:hypothetical protein WV31_10840 [Magnetospirillum sp. ME-1]|uniref:hypothetical protein n=1 Tax=Magnetospirillum sp. ME-1 TaxID=1639348 RepID=UPI000A17B453|nr:hypothetical protein [Magnetospirillum sp. ME-1]ARJ66124.1 hypothetical protein WV31_10840 [Magnetospirillum sp. ME-1]